jgi:hypothetical protein
LDLIKNYFLEANPNPEREGCPNEATIKALAEGRLPLSHPGHLHFAGCSECFAEYRGFRLKWVESRKAQRRIAAWAVAACLALFAAGGLWRVEHSGAVNSATFERAAGAPVSAQVDLFNAGTFRGAAPGINDLQSVTLPAAVVHLSLTLPRFSEPGQYQILISKGKMATKIVAKSVASTQKMNGRETLDVTLDLRAVNRGSYFLTTVRGRDSGTYYYPLAVK